jgi:organic radical activating enzyme
MNRITFPIKSEKACLLKWAWSTVFLQSGTSSSCHRVIKHAIDPDQFDNFHNLPEKIQARELMLQGSWPGAGCEYCKDVEDAGGVSDRLSQLDRLVDIKLIPPELLENPSATAVTPTILEVYFKNTCNMACVYCGPHFSSRWVDENKKFGSLYEKNNSTYQFSVAEEQHNPHYTKMLDGLWNFLKTNDNAKKIRRYHILGGEPFLLDELDQSIAFWDEYGHPNLVINIITNINIPHERFVRYINKFESLSKKNKISKLSLTASLDCWSIEQEYVRYGLSLSLWEKNFEFLLNKPWIDVSINSAISALTIKSMPALIKKINQWNENQLDVVNDDGSSYSTKIWHSFNTSGMQDNLYIFAGDTFKADFEEILDLMPVSSEGHVSQTKQSWLS